MSPQDRWTLAQAMHGLREANRILDTQYEQLPVNLRVRLVTAKANFEYVIEHLLEKNLGKRHEALA